MNRMGKSWSGARRGIYTEILQCWILFDRYSN